MANGKIHDQESIGDDRDIPVIPDQRRRATTAGPERLGGETGTDAVRGEMAFRIFIISWIFFGITAALGFFLRMQFVFPIAGFNYGNFLHTHSHLAFLGWVYNAFFALAVRFFVPTINLRAYWLLFLATQVPLVGILVTFPLQGYARESIIFSSLHMLCAAIFVCKLLRQNRAAPIARLYLGAAAVFMLASTLGPLAIAPIRVAGLGETAWYDFAIGYYLHFQYNGWFIFFLIAVFYQAMHERKLPFIEQSARTAFRWLLLGCVLTLSLAALPMNPPLFIFLAAAGGGVAQALGCFSWVRGLRGASRFFASRPSPVIRWMALGAISLLVLKFGLQALAAWPGLSDLATNRFTIIAFMHLIFLGIVTPTLIAWGIELGWIHLRVISSLGLGLFALGAFVSQLALGYMPLAGWFGWPSWPAFFETQFISALVMLLGSVFIGLGFSSNNKIC